MLYAATDRFSRRYYPDYLSFFHGLIVTLPVAPSLYANHPSSVVPVLEKYLFGIEGLLVRALSGVMHPLIHIGYGLEFALGALVAEGERSSSFPPAWDPRLSFVLQVSHKRLVSLPASVHCSTRRGLPLQRSRPHSSPR